MSEQQKEIYEVTDVRQYLQMLQDTINRMASNSSNCKNWTLTIVTALIALCAASVELNEYLLIAVIPICMFWALDFYYLLLENKFRKHEKEFITRYHNGDNTWKDLIYRFDISIPKGNNSCSIKKHCLKSKSIVMFYPIILFLVLLLSCFMSNRVSQSPQDLKTPLQEIGTKLDSIVNAIKSQESLNNCANNGSENNAIKARDKIRDK